MKGVAGKILRVDLTTRKTSVDSIPDRLWVEWLGGRGLGAKLLMDETPAGIDPLSPSSKLFFMLSPLVGTLTPGISKTALTFKSPLTGGVFVSLCGGDLGATLKFAGWDGIVIEGKADAPCVLVVKDDRVSVDNAPDLVGLEVAPTDEALRKKYGGEFAQTIVVGPAGEKLVRFASLHSGRGREFGRGGAGAVFGSKNLKGIVIVGSGGVRVSDRERLERLTVEAYTRLRDSEKTKTRRRWGTLELVATINELGFWPTRNYSEGQFEHAGKLDGGSIEKTALAGHRSCHSCPVSCGKIINYRKQDGSLVELEGPEFESLSLLGPNLGIGDMDAIAEATALCDELGVDTISMGNAIGLVFEAAEAGRLPNELKGSLDLRFGAASSVLELIRMTARAEGALGKLIGLGTRALAREIECEDLAMDVKGLALPAYDPRGVKGLGLTYATAASGASHMRGPTMGSEITANTRLDESGKAALVRDMQVSMALADSTCLCSTVRAGIDVRQLAEFIEAVTGEPCSADDLVSRAMNILTLERRINIREGFTSADDTLPTRSLKTPMPAGPGKGRTVDLAPMLKDFYMLMGWDENGVPPPEVNR